jgi:hypothetical protein
LVEEIRMDGSSENIYESGVEVLNKEIGHVIYLVLVVEVA